MRHIEDRTKHYGLIAACAVLLALATSSCGPTEEEDIVVIASPSEFTVAPGETLSLTVIVYSRSGIELGFHESIVETAVIRSVDSTCRPVGLVLGTRRSPVKSGRYTSQSPLRLKLEARTSVKPSGELIVDFGGSGIVCISGDNAQIYAIVYPATTPLSLSSYEGWQSQSMKLLIDRRQGG